MASSTLAAAFKDLQGDIGHFLGYGRGPDFGDREWTEKQKQSIKRCTKGGMRKFYFNGHPWSFLKPVADLTLVAEANTLTLPDDFGGVEGTLLITDSDSTSWQVLQYGSIAQVYEQQARSTSSGRPVICCLEPINEQLHGQAPRSRLRFWPTAEREYTIKLQYYLLPDYLTGEKPYAIGGAEHAETLLESCLAVAEKIMDDTAAVHSAEFEMCLKRSIDLDSRKKPRNLGVNRDLSDLDASGRVGMERYTDTRVSFEGTFY